MMTLKLLMSHLQNKKTKKCNQHDTKFKLEIFEAIADTIDRILMTDDKMKQFYTIVREINAMESCLTRN